MIRNLGHRLVTDLATRTPNQNVFVSPVSIGMALSLIAGGAAGETRAAILTALGVPSTDQEQLNQYYIKLAHQLAQLDPDLAELIAFGAYPDREPAARVDIANGLWLNKDLPFLQAFADHARQIYQAEVSGADFSTDETIEIINRWVSERTQSNIDQIISELNPQTSLILINAVYFKGSWNTPFDIRKTQEAPFTQSDGSQITCDLMYQSEWLPYAENDTFQIALMPIAGTRYGRKEGAQLAIVLPQPGKSCAEALAALGPKWQASLAKERVIISEQEIRFWLPRFRISYSTSLNDTLEALGMGIAFSNQADFIGISSTPTKISDVQHKTTLLVNELGAEASAATRAGMSSFGLLPEPKSMRVDRPFICGIVLNPDLTPLFLGVINQPERTSTP
ncbi:MAG: serpin family protein [Oscillochloris sp.]|nr:serpin family protein [Oscillochloris sp.]